MSTAFNPQLEAMQSAITQTLLEGPSHCPPDLFAGAAADYLRGLRVYATTISHARMVALEDSFPKCRSFLGEETFHSLSQDFLGKTQAKTYKIADIGAGFVEYLHRSAGGKSSGDTSESSNESSDTSAAIMLATLEWAWLAAYSAAEGVPLTLPDIAQYDQAALLALRVVRHPTVQLLTIPPTMATIPPLFDSNLPAASGVLLIHRPQAEVYARFIPASWHNALESATEPIALANILEILSECVISAATKDMSGADDDIPAFIKNSIIMKAGSKI